PVPRCPAPAPLPLFLIPAGVALAGAGFHVVEPHVLGAGPVRPRLLARYRTGVAADALVQVHHHGHLRHYSHSSLLLFVPKWARAFADHRDLITLVSRRPVVVERERQLPVPADEVGGLEHDPRERVVDPAALPARFRDRGVDGA